MTLKLKYLPLLLLGFSAFSPAQEIKSEFNKEVTLKLAGEHPEMFAAVAAVCAPTDRVMVANIHQYKNLNIKLFHGGMDDVVLPENAFNFYQKLHPVNPKAELTIFPNDNHNSWDSTYADPKLWSWMFSQKLISK